MFTRRNEGGLGSEMSDESQTALPQTAPKTTVVETIESTTRSEGPKSANAESQAFGISIRGWVTLLVLGTMCIMSVLGKPVDEPLRSATIAALAFYFGQKTTK